MHTLVSYPAKKAIGVSSVSIYAVILLAFACVTYARNMLWRDEMTLYQDVIKKSSDKARAILTLRMAEDSSDIAIARYQNALRSNPDYVEAHNNLGIAYKRRGLTDKAIEHFQAALRLQPDRAEIYNNLGNIYDSSGFHDKAVECYMSAIKIKPDYAAAYYNLGIAHEHKGLIDKAIEQYQIALKIQPTLIAAEERLSLHTLRHREQD